MATALPIRLVLADEHPLMLDALEALFAREGDFEVLDRCVDATGTLAAINRDRPHVLVLDPSLPGAGGLAIVSAVAPETSVVLFTASSDDDLVADAIRRGARGVVPKRMPPKLLVDCVRTVHAGGRWIERDLTRDAVERLVKREASSQRHAAILTARERDIVDAVAGGLRNRGIGEKLGISERTVKVHLHNVYEKLGLNGRLALLRYARDHDLV